MPGFGRHSSREMKLVPHKWKLGYRKFVSCSATARKYVSIQIKTRFRVNSVKPLFNSSQLNILLSDREVVRSDIFCAVRAEAI
jgi:hypothetical protein